MLGIGITCPILVCQFVHLKVTCSFLNAVWVQVSKVTKAIYIYFSR